MDAYTLLINGRSCVSLYVPRKARNDRIGKTQLWKDSPPNHFTFRQAGDRVPERGDEQVT